MAAICGQEIGTKQEILGVARKYALQNVLMVGDAPGDYQAAQGNDTLFYPVNPGAEDASWQRFFEEAIDRFLSRTYAGKYQQDLLDEFDSYLPSQPPWERTGL